MIVRISGVLAALVLCGVVTAGAQSGSSIDICEAIDTSRSISDDNLEIEIRGFQAAFDDVLIPEVDSGRSIGLAIVGFSSDVQTFLPLTQIDGNRNQIRNAYDAVADTTDRNLTNLGGALQRCTDLLANSTADRKVIDLSTDGRPTTGPDTRQAATQAKNSGIEIWTLGVGSGVDTALLESIVGCPSGTANCLAANFQVMTFQDFPQILRQKTGEIANGGDNDPPQANDDNTVTAPDAPVTISALANDADPDNDDLTIEDVASPDNGSATTNGATITYTPDAGFTGTDSFTYTVGDGRGGSDTATVTVDVQPGGAPGNTPPTAVSDAERTGPDTPVTVDVLNNDADPDNDALSLLSVGDPNDGSAVLNNDGTITYTPDPGFRGTDRFNYTISDGRGGTATATVGIGVGVSPPPVDDDDDGTAGIPGLTPPWLALFGALLVALMARELWRGAHASSAN